MKYTSLSLVICSLFLFWGCEEETQVGNINELSVQAYLFAGDPVDTVKFSRLVPLDSTQNIDIPTDLQATIEVDSQRFGLTQTGIPGVFQNLDLTIVSGKTYKLEVPYQGEIVSAETFIPTAAADLSLSRTVIELKEINDFTDVFDQEPPEPIEVTWTGSSGSYYYVTVESIESDPDPVNTIFEDGEAPARPNFQTAPSTATFYDINTFQDITYFGTYEVTVYSVNPEYVAVYDDNSTGGGNLNEITTNVKNGFGLFTGVNRSSVQFEVKRQ